MATIIKPFDAIYSYEPGFGFSGGYQDISYVFQDGGGNLIAMLFAYYQLSLAPFSYPQVFLSADSGVSWSQVGSGRPNSYIPLLYDPNYTAASVTILYAVDTNNNFALVDYDFATNTYGAPYGALGLHLGPYSDVVGMFAGRSDGSKVLTYESYLGGGAYRIFSGGAWSAETVLPSASSGKGGRIGVDALDNVHLILSAPNGQINYCLLDPATDTITVGPIILLGPFSASGAMSNLIIVGTTVSVALLNIASGQWQLFTADTPFNVWTATDITGMDSRWGGSVWMADSPPTAHVVAFAQGPFDNSPSINVDTYLLNQSISAVDTIIYAARTGDVYVPRQTRIDKFKASTGVWSGPTTVYSAPYNAPPDDWANVFIWHLNILAGAVPTGARIVHHTTNSYLASGALAGNRYRGFYQ